tara:strand:- start:1928 stop:2509 length:582 start_codon:yes stop_codon:yes gene_type:complete
MEQITDAPVVDHFWKNNDLGWISIPKNANMATRYLLEYYGCKRQHYSQMREVKKMLIVLRNPYYRLISGLFESNLRKEFMPWTNVDYGLLLQHLYHNPRDFDEHVEPQSVFIKNIKFTHILQFELLNKAFKDIGVFKPKVIDHFIHKDKLHSSKAGDLRIILNNNRKWVDRVVEKYYTKDIEVYKNPHSLLKT